jgi:hypothetical protein
MGLNISVSEGCAENEKAMCIFIIPKSVQALLGLNF